MNHIGGLSQPHVRRICLPLLAIAATLIVLGPLLRYRAAVRRRTNPDESAVLPTMFDVNTEANIPSWFSASLWLLCAVAAVSIGVLLGRASWYLLAGVCALASADEAAALHEAVLGGIAAQIDSSAMGLLHFTWVVPGALVASLVALMFWRLMRSLPRRARRGLIVAGALFLTGSIGAESISGLVFRAQGDGFGYVVATSVEEAMEMTAVILFLATLLSLLHFRRGAHRVFVDVDARLLPRRRGTLTQGPGYRRVSTIHGGALAS
ncbi:hypothetical protein EK0264_13190 [Epidermidibacterium keratini]|uniref:Uncharacterized protein n=1 Tax=Epidermidibacterium keratini TaxID=1891644 RepID=A0A7L4YQ54_9ACTN|nr:hypothetical protein [Epidermidibacterium keratini]QHC01152.1 hypothetical protein EK0264_13190 [Epidermidibacterium keratini]